MYIYIFMYIIMCIYIEREIQVIVLRNHGFSCFPYHCQLMSTFCRYMFKIVFRFQHEVVSSNQLQKPEISRKTQRLLIHISAVQKPVVWMLKSPFFVIEPLFLLGNPHLCQVNYYSWQVNRTFFRGSQHISTLRCVARITSGYLSQGTTLLPGTVILTGTPPGTG